MHEYEEANSRSVFTSFLNNLLKEYLVTLGNLLSIEFMKPKRGLYATLGRQTWVPQELGNKMLKPSMNC
jgi:hypothetical protein